MSNSGEAIRTTYRSIFTSICLAAVKWMAGIFGNSHALVADAIESTSDVFSSFLVLLGLRYAKKPADRNHPYGHGRIEPLVTFAVVIILAISAFLIAWESIRNIQTPHAPPKAWTLIVLAAVILWKEITFRAIARKAKALHSSSLKADAWHHRSDALTSVAAFVGICVAVAFGEGYESADDWAALFASALILYNCYGIFRPALAEVMDEHCYEEMEADVRRESLLVDGVLATEKCLIRKIGMLFQIDLHAIVSPDLSVRQGHDIAHALKDHLMAHIPSVGNVFVHIEPFDAEKQNPFEHPECPPR